MKINREKAMPFRIERKGKDTSWYIIFFDGVKMQTRNWPVYRTFGDTEIKYREKQIKKIYINVK